MSDTYKIATSSKTKTYFMVPYKVAFYIYTTDKPCTLEHLPDEEIIIVDTDIEDINMLDTMLYNAGFQRGTIDGISHIISKPNINYTNVNKNDIMLAQYILTNDIDYLKQINTKQLYTLAQIGEDYRVYYPTLRDKNGVKVLTYTSRFNIPNEMYQKYKDFSLIKVGQLTKENCSFLINNQFLLNERKKYARTNKS